MSIVTKTENSTDINCVLSGLKKVKSTGINKWQALCPAHNDNNPSLGISIGNDEHILFYCFAGCKYESIISALGLISQQRQITAEYDYVDENGELLYQVIRYEPKDFRQRRPDRLGNWVWNLDEVRRVLYKLPQVITANTEEAIYICEGEKDADKLASLGLVATTNAGGAGKWREEYNEYLNGRDIVILPDNDETGLQHANQVANSLYRIAAAVKIVELPDLPAKGDVSDFLNNGGTVKTLQDIVANTELFNPSISNKSIQAKAALQFSTESAADLLSRDFPEPKWAINGLQCEGATLLAGPPKAGKSFMALGKAIAVASGGRALGSIPVTQGDVLYVSLEDGARRIKKRLMEMLKNNRAPVSLNFAYNWRRLDEGGIEDLERWLEAHPNARLIVIDTLQRVRPIDSRNKRLYAGDYDAISPLNDLALKYGVAIDVIHHDNKLSGNEDWFDSISGTKGLTGAVDNAWLLRRPRGQQKGKLYIAGRDIEDREFEVEFDGVINGWRLLGDAVSDLAQKLEKWLQEAGEAGLSRYDINRKNGGRTEGLNDALAELKSYGRSICKMMPTRGKPQERWIHAQYIKHDAVDVINAKRSADTASIPPATDFDVINVIDDKRLNLPSNALSTSIASNTSEQSAAYLLPKIQGNLELEERKAIMEFDGNLSPEGAEYYSQLKSVDELKLMPLVNNWRIKLKPQPIAERALPLSERFVMPQLYADGWRLGSDGILRNERGEPIF